MNRQSKNKAISQSFRAWLQQHHQVEMVQQAGAQPLHRDMLTLLTFVRDNKVVGTQSTGNMPLKAVRAVTAHFVNPPQLDTTIGDHTYRLRSEADIWPLYFLHILAEVGGLLSIAPARRWRLTAKGTEFLNIDALIQMANLMTIWWYQVNWLVAYPISGMGGDLPDDFESITLTHLCAQRVGAMIDFEAFADELIAATKLTWTAPDMSWAQQSLQASIGRMVIYILAAFGALEYTKREEPLGKETIERLDTFKITPLGEALLGAAALVAG